MNTENETGGLSSAAQVEAMADQLVLCADEIHKRIKKQIGDYNGGPVSDADQDLMRALQDDEVLLRLRADGLYADAATLVVKSLGQSQQKLVQLTVAAAEKIRKISRLADLAGLAGGLLMLAGAIATGQAVPIVAAIEKVTREVKVVKASTPTKAA